MRCNLPIQKLQYVEIKSMIKVVLALLDLDFFLFPVTFCQIGLYFDELHFNSETIFEPCLFFRQEKNISEASNFYFSSKHGSPVQTYIHGED